MGQWIGGESASNFGVIPAGSMRQRLESALTSYRLEPVSQGEITCILETLRAPTQEMWRAAWNDFRDEAEVSGWGWSQMIEAALQNG